MVIPNLRSRVEQRQHSPRDGITAGSTIAFGEVAGHAGERAISWIVSALERSRHNVFEMKTVAAANLGGAAILTTSACSRLHKSTKRFSRWRQVTTRWL